MKPIITTVSLIVLSMTYFGAHYIYYGSLTRSCIYTENKLPVPEQLLKDKIIAVKNIYIAKGRDKEYGCLKNFGNIDRKIVGPESINNITIGRKYYTARGLTVESLKKGTSFNIVDVITVTKHGISTIDSGPGPIYYLILKDKNNILYEIATVSLGINKDDLFLSLMNPSEPIDTPLVKLLNSYSFNNGTKQHGGDNSFIFTGELTALQKSDLH